MIGQRAIYHDVIVTVCTPVEQDGREPIGDIIWVDNPAKGHKHWVSGCNLKPLPNGQL